MGDSSALIRDRPVMELIGLEEGGELLHSNLPATAAACLFHLFKNRPFWDGNKRVALAVPVE